VVKTVAFRTPFADAPILALALMLTAAGLAAEAIPSAEIFMDSSIVAGEKGVDAIDGASVGGIRFSLDSAKGGAFRGNDALRGTARVTVTDKDKPTLDRAYFKARFPWLVENTSLRFTAGKAPLSWGKGFLFNAGDPVFGAMPAVTTISTDEYRTQADWMGVLYLPAGEFSFAELIALPPVEMPEPRAGGRFVFAPRLEYWQSIEGGYLYERTAATRPAHKAYIALDGSFWFDWYAAASAFDGDYAVSFGLLRIFSPAADVPLTLRGEGLVYPEESKQYWYPSLILGLTNEFEFGIQGIIETGDTIAGTGGITGTFTPIKGFALSGAVMKQLEKGESVTRDVLLKIGCKCVF
jgi:hypothetical protein